MSHIHGEVFNIMRYAIHDGPGIRTLVFLKGCPLNCLWCANPEGKRSQPEIVYTRRFCIGCGCCVAACDRGALHLTAEGIQIDRQACDLCGHCADQCHAEALAINSRIRDVEDVVAEVERDRVFYATSGGGVTLSGGEPMAQPEFAQAILAACRERGIATALETCGCYPFDTLKPMLGLLDCILYDLKHTDPARHREVTGVDNRHILENLERLQNYDIDLYVRVPVIPTVNDDEATIAAIADLLKGMPRVRSVELLPYHRFGVHKYDKLGLTYPLPHASTPDPATMERLVDVMKAGGISEVRLHQTEKGD